MAHLLEVGAQPLPRVRPTTWRFDLTLLLPACSSAEVRLPCIPHHSWRCSGQPIDPWITRPLLFIPCALTWWNCKTSKTTVKRWLFDYWIIPGNMHWTPVEPCQTGDWRQPWQACIRAIFLHVNMAAYNSITGCKKHVQRNSRPESPEDRANRHQSILQILLHIDIPSSNIPANTIGCGSCASV